MKIPIHHRLSCLKKGTVTATAAVLSLLLAHAATAADPDKTPEDVQKKAVIVKHDAKLFKKASGDEGDQAKFMQIYFKMKPAVGERVPVSRSANKKGQPDGWLQNGSYMEWNTLQMIKLEPQSGRKLAKVFDNQSCAEMFGKDGQDAAGCQEIGAEPNRFASKTEPPQLLIPVFEKQKNSYQGGFIRVYEKGSAVKAADATGPKTSGQGGTAGKLGYDIVFAVDSTGSMGEYFIPTTEVLQSFIKHIKEVTKDGELNLPRRIGLLFYKDRLSYFRCPHPFPITEWKQELTEDIDKVIEALKSAEEETCTSEDSPEAVLDGLNRVIVDIKWQDNHFKAIVLVGDAGPHPENSDKNPMSFTVAGIGEIAEKQKIRFLTFKLGSDEKAFKELAYAVKDEQNKGRYKAIPKSDDKEAFKESLLDAMTKEWGMLTKAQKFVKGGDSRAALSKPQVQQKYDLTPYEALIIQARLPDTVSASQAIPEFVKGWLPKEIQTDLIVSEFLFMGKSRLTIMASILEGLAEAALIGGDEGGDVFIEVIRNVLASQLKVPASQLFGSGESVNSILKKANILPFKTQVLSFTPNEISTFKPEDYERIHTILKEKVKILREFMGNPTNNRYFGNKPHLYVPRAFFP